MILWGQRATTNFVIKLLDNVGAETTLLDYSKFLILFLILFSMIECLLMSLTCSTLMKYSTFYVPLKMIELLDDAI